MGSQREGKHMSEPTLVDIAQQLTDFRRELTDFRNDTRHRLDTIDTRLQLHGEILGRVEKRLDTLDSRLYDFSMRIVTTNQSAFWGVGIALLSAAIAFVVSRISGGEL